MDDLISRAAAIECAIDAVDDWDGGWNPNREEVIRKYFEELPAVDAVPVVHAYWVEEPDRVNHWHCSNCECPVGIASIAYRYCYACGAKMAERPRAADGCGQTFSPDGDANG